MFLMLYFGKKFGLSSSLRTVCAIGGAGKVVDFFDFEWKADIWNLIFIVGTIIGGFIASSYLSDGTSMQLSGDTLVFLAELGIDKPRTELVPTELFSWEMLLTTKGLIMMVLGGFLIGFGARYAGGCTSGHAISGLSNLQLPSLIAVIGFFIGGMITTYLLLPYLLG